MKIISSKNGWCEEESIIHSVRIDILSESEKWSCGFHWRGWGVESDLLLSLFRPACVWRHTTHSDLLCHSAFRKWKHDRIKWQFKKNLIVACVRVLVTPEADIYTPNSDPYRRPWGTVIDKPTISSLCLIKTQAIRTYWVEDREWPQH